MREIRIFYSWQSDDCETSDCIEHVLNDAIGDLRAEFGGRLRIVLDKDTHGEFGAPNITNVILEKIAKADIVVSDVSYVGDYKDKKIVNQNVMFETGYAIAKHSTNSVIMLFNKDNGSAKDLPFDISHNRVTGFSMNGNDKFRAEVFNMMRSMIKHRLVENGNFNNGLSKLDAEQIEVMKLIASVQKEKNLILSDFGIFGGVRVWSYHKYDKQKKATIMNKIGIQKFIANLSDLVSKDILKKRVEGRSAIFEPTKAGFNIIDNIDSY